MTDDNYTGSRAPSSDYEKYADCLAARWGGYAIWAAYGCPPGYRDKAVALLPKRN